MNRLLLLILALLCLAPLAGAASTPTATTPIGSDVEAATTAVQRFVQRNVGTFSSYQGFVVGDPTAPVKEIASIAKASKLPEIILTVAMIIAITGFIKRGWEIMAGSGESKSGFMLQFIAVAILISFSFNLAQSNSKTQYTVSYVALNSWGNAMNWSNKAFTTKIDTKLEAASDAMVDAVSRAAFVATSLAAGQVAVGAATMKGGAAALAKSGAKTGGQNFMKSIAAQAKVSMGFMVGMIVAYGNIVMISGLMVLFAVYVFPIGVAAIMWGQSKIVWACVGTFLGAWMVALILPLITHVNIERVFVQPAKMAAKFEAEMGVAAYVSAVQADVAGDTFNQKLDEYTEDCRNKQAADPSIECMSDGGSSLVKSIWKPVSNTLTIYMEAFKVTIGKFIDSLAALVMQIFFGITFYVAALASMFVISAYVMQLLGSVASSFGNAGLPKFNLGGLGRKR
ncbi:hypothetical protein [Deinococcus enclensis]|uniref:TrbL/VirB6 plasmid conjugal transfer protein n=1 Tax=Deinococcus enclensis TaxID=1049582 RepID=A0ABT9MI34_9DEIO|nr:hypothetical protein [Deinococcus enclensis]MDP9766121.1 hypothetical protein [Deinococcus enclensis]